MKEEKQIVIKLVRKLWLEILLGISIFMIGLLSWKNVFSDLKIEHNYKNRLPEHSETLPIASLPEYLSILKKLDNCTIFFTVKDIQGFSLKKEHTDALKDLGFERADILLEHEPHNFIGIYSNGKVLYQYIGGDEASSYQGTINDQYVVVKSETLKRGNKGIVYIDNISYAVNSRGLNIVVLDDTNHTIIDSIAYDTHEEKMPVYRLQNGKCVMVADRTEGEERE